MNKIFFLIICIAIAVSLVMCSGEQKQEAASEETTEEATSTAVEDTSMALCANDCGMEMEKSKMIAYESDDETLYFCSEKCKEEYLANTSEESEQEEM